MLIIIILFFQHWKPFSKAGFMGCGWWVAGSLGAGTLQVCLLVQRYQEGLRRSMNTPPPLHLLDPFCDTSFPGCLPTPRGSDCLFSASSSGTCASAHHLRVSDPQLPPCHPASPIPSTASQQPLLNPRHQQFSILDAFKSSFLSQSPDLSFCW